MMMTMMTMKNKAKMNWDLNHPCKKGETFQFRWAEIQAMKIVK